jgi:hypothetical protein
LAPFLAHVNQPAVPLFCVPRQLFLTIFDFGPRFDGRLMDDLLLPPRIGRNGPT